MVVIFMHFLFDAWQLFCSSAVRDEGLRAAFAVGSDASVRRFESWKWCSASTSVRLKGRAGLLCSPDYERFMNSLS